MAGLGLLRPEVVLLLVAGPAVPRQELHRRRRRADRRHRQRDTLGILPGRGSARGLDPGPRRQDYTWLDFEE